MVKHIKVMLQSCIYLELDNKPAQSLDWAYIELRNSLQPLWSTWTGDRFPIISQEIQMRIDQHQKFNFQ